MVCLYFDNNLRIRNIQLSTYSGFFAFTLMCFNSGDAILNDGIFFGFTKWVWLVIFNQALGGMLISHFNSRNLRELGSEVRR